MRARRFSNAVRTERGTSDYEMTILKAEHFRNGIIARRMLWRVQWEVIMMNVICFYLVNVYGMNTFKFLP
ncbi:hypothetical protein CEXT_637781 [Caerostris extrusa]|uniref:Uncharacterized protein n=1 Tax=Caerostris extrusa TaxID=172846 RepID=A0AAV4UJH9_CAEEX|nr:hypothetical protein CEXT_637781 [Caerostris extrusa]